MTDNLFPLQSVSNEFFEYKSSYKYTGWELVQPVMYSQQAMIYKLISNKEVNAALI